MTIIDTIREGYVAMRFIQERSVLQVDATLIADQYTIAGILCKGTLLISMMLSISMLPASIHANPSSKGSALSTIESSLDQAVLKVMRDNRIPGMTVAVADNGKMILNKGYGYARKSKKLIPMQPEHRTMIGSTGKALVTGPVALQVMDDARIIPVKKKIYGKGGVFGDRYLDDITVGVSRYWPIAATAVSADNKLYTWYMNGTYSIGTGENLAYHQGLRQYSLPPGRRYTEILDIAISANNWVHTWFIDGSHSVGRARDLDSRSAPESKKTKVPKGTHYVDIVGIAIGKTGNQVHVWYTDGTYSVGNTSDFSVHRDKRPFTQGGTSRFNIRGIGLAPGGRSYTLLSKGGRLKGSVADLSSVSASGSYTIPAISLESSAGSWYRTMTLQNLLDHKAGFVKGGDGDDAAVMFGVTKERLTYHQIHRHFLRTRPLQTAPGEHYSYSNHGFGLWTLLVKEISGISYRDYAITKYLKPIKLSGSVRPLVETKDRFDACPHKITDDKVIVRKHWNSTTGLAAGGWTAAASNMLRIMDHLHGRYGPDRLEDAGWAVRSDGKLGHSGKVPNAGTAYVAMFPAESSNATGQGVHVALAANAGVNSDALRQLSNVIEEHVRQATIDPDFDLFKAKSTLSYQNFGC